MRHLASVGRALLGAAALALVFVPLGGGAQAQTFPSKPIRLVLPYVPGGIIDNVGRHLAQRLGENLGQTVVAENRPGAGGMVGTDVVARSAPDGYTILLTDPALVSNPTLQKDAPYELAKLQAISIVGSSPAVIVGSLHLPVKTFAELLAYAKANPGKLNYGSAGHGNATHLAAELFKLRTGIDIVHVPYKGAADAVTGVLGGQVQMFFGDIGGVLALVREGTLRALAVSSETRTAFLPDVPTMMESGVSDYVVLTYIGVVAPAGTAEGIVVKLNAAINASLASPQIAAAFAKLGAEVRPAPPRAFAALLATETQKWSEVAKTANIKLE
jgi:tripartite-type tricarboxylate transporter receptor subunit TctC